VGFRTDTAVHYFWTWRPGRVLALLKELDYLDR
jgi:hypothetical protein